MTPNPFFMMSWFAIVNAPNAVIGISIFFYPCGHWGACYCSSLHSGYRIAIKDDDFFFKIIQTLSNSVKLLNVLPTSILSGT